MTDQETSGSTPLFGVFLLSIVSIILVPYTLYKLFGGDVDDKEVVKTWSSKKDAEKSSLVSSVVYRLRSTFPPKMLVAWTLYLLLLWYVKAASSPMERFDPFEILQLNENASESEIKRAYRRLSLQYHPDKNPDPAAADYFAQYVAKAYKALTDEASRENYKKYGHPDGPQAVSISVALPEWFFNKDKEAAPAILLSLLLGGIVLPLSLAACYLGRTQRYAGPNEVMMETVQWYLYSPYAIKQFQGVGKLPETLVCAMEFIPPQLPMPANQGPALDALRREVGSHFPEVRDRNGPFFRKRNQALVKAHMLILAHLARVAVPPALKKDQLYVLEKAPRLMQEMFAVATAPRVKPCYGWLTPAVGCVELMQCLVQAVSTEEKKKVNNPAKGADSAAALLQLPHVDDAVARALVKRKIKSLPELQGLPRKDRRAALQGLGISRTDADDIETALSALPCVFVTANLAVDEVDAEGNFSGGGEAVGESSVVCCTVNAMLWRASHQAPGFDPDTIKGTASRAYAPNYPFPKDEHWFFLLGEPSEGALLAWTRVSLMEAEAVGARYAANWITKTTAGAGARGGGAADGSDNPLLGGSRGSALLAAAAGEGFESEEALVEKLGQKIELKFLAPKAGKHDLVLYVMPDSWLGADRVLPLKLRTIEASRAEKEGRTVPRAGTGGGGGGKKKPLQRSEESELELDGGGGAAGGGEGTDSDAEGGGGGRGSDLGSDEEEEEEEEGEPEWDSDEYGTEESGDETESVAGED